MMTMDGRIWQVDRPGPDFYINKIDNTIRHGPGGQIMHTGEMHNEADPCTRPFTSIIDAIDMGPGREI